MSLEFPSERWNLSGLDVTAVLERIDAASRIADCGCYGWTLAAACRARGHELWGLDRTEPPGRPDGARFFQMERSRLHVADDTVDLCVASHLLEHLQDPVELFGELARIAAPGGLIWVESPSELSAQQRGSDRPDDHAFQSFWDDPTHVRPWTPGALYRLALSWRCMPLHCSRAVAAGIPVSRLLAQKPAGARGATPYAFVSLKDVAPGLRAAWAHVWPESR